MRSGFEEYYSKKYPNDQCTLMRNGNYSGWLKQQQWEQWQHQQSKLDELQKRMDAAQKLIESWNKTEFDKTTHWTEGYEQGCYHCAAQLEQALKGVGNDCKYQERTK